MSTTSAHWTAEGRPRERAIVAVADAVAAEIVTTFAKCRENPTTTVDRDWLRWLEQKLGREVVRACRKIDPNTFILCTVIGDDLRDRTEVRWHITDRGRTPVP